MIYQVFSVRDNAVMAYLPPFFSRSKGEAVRSFAEACNNREHQFFRHAHDYSLFWMGEFDDANGALLGGNPTRILGAHECVVDDNVAGPGSGLGNGAVPVRASLTDDVPRS